MTAHSSTGETCEQPEAPLLRRRLPRRRVGYTVVSSASGFADVGEAYATARRLGTKPDAGAWYVEWTKAADRATAIAENALAGGHRVTAARAHLRASEYHREAFFFLRGNLDNPRTKSGWAGHVASFAAAAPLLDVHAEQVRIPYDGTTLKGWTFAPDDSTEPRPTVLMPAGYDSTAEFGWMFAPEALSRGYRVLSFEGPGQGEALYERCLYMRPDSEHVRTPVVDWLVAQPGVDPSRLGLIGLSFAGYLAPRGVTVEHRIAALVVNPAQPDVGTRVPAGLAGRIAAPAVTALTRVSEKKHEFFASRMATHGVDSIEQYFDVLKTFTMTDSIGDISCPTLIVDAANDLVSGNAGAQPFADALRCPPSDRAPRRRLRCRRSLRGPRPAGGRRSHRRLAGRGARALTTVVGGAPRPASDGVGVGESETVR